MPTLWLAWAMQQAGWIMPVDMTAAEPAGARAVLVVTFWATCIVYNVFQGLYYGMRTRAVHGRHHAGGRGHAVHRLHGA